MKKILQAMDGVSTKPVEGVSDMSKFVSIIQEGANPHKVTLPVQMAMQHYQEPKVEKKTLAKESIIGKYFALVEEEQVQKQEEKKELVRQYASIIAERVMMKESTQPQVEDGGGATDTVTVDIPLLIRLLEYAREDAKTDMDLHNVAERLIHLSQEGVTLTMDNYNDICPQQDSEGDM
jgi:hypothetical protein